MSSYVLPRLSKPEIIRSINLDRLRTLLLPHSEWLIANGLTPPDANGRNDFDYQQLATLLTHPDADTPRSLLESFYMIDQMSMSQTANMIVHDIGLDDLQLSTEDDHSPADIAAQAWLLHRDKLMTLHARQRILRSRSFSYFQTRHLEIPKFIMPTSAVIATLEWECDSWFENKARGRGTKINIFADKHLVQMSIRHGSLFRREEVMSKNQITIAGFRPVDGDTVIYDRRLPEITSVQLKYMSCNL